MSPPTFDGTDPARPASETCDVISPHSTIDEVTDDPTPEREQNIRALFEESPAGILRIELDDTISEVNNRACEILGYSREELLGRTTVEITHPDDQREGREKVRALNAGRVRRLSLTKRYLRGNGAAVRVRLTSRAVRHPDGSIAYRLTMIEDLTALAEAEARWHAEASRFRLVVEAAPNAMIVVDRSGAMTLANAQAERLFGYSRAELLGQPVEMLVPGRFRGEHARLRHGFLGAPQNRAMGGGRELFGVRKDGAEVPIEIGLNPMETADGPQVLASIIDITERKRAEQRFRLLVEAAPNAMVLAGSSGDIALVNAQAERLFGYSREELLGKPVEVLVPERYHGDYAALRRSFLAAPRARSLGGGREIYGLRKDGTEVPIEIGLNPMETAEGFQVLACVIDITERKRAETERARYMAELQRSNRDLDAFAYVASHDLRAPLRAIQNLAGWIAKDAGAVLPEQSARHLSLLIARTQRLERLLDDLLTYSRAGRMLGELDVIDVADVVDEVIELLAPRPEFSIRAEGPMPVVRSYRAPIRELLLNLIGNAIKHHDLQRGSVTVECGRTGGRIMCTVTDDGPGIPREHREQVFGMFQTLRARDEVEGSGMGLAFVKKLVESQGGQVGIVETRRDRGTSVFFTWPVEDAPFEPGKAGRRPQTTRCPATESAGS